MKFNVVFWPRKVITQTQVDKWLEEIVDLAAMQQAITWANAESHDLVHHMVSL